jgi:predicted dehydrogenase
MTEHHATTGDTGVPPVRVGLVGAGPWASLFHAPMLAGSPETELAGVWARRPEPAEQIAGTHGTRAFGHFDEMLEHVDALAFAVPPDIQAELATAGAQAGKALLLEKPIALDLGAARDLAAVVSDAGVPTQMVLTWRYSGPVRRFIEACQTIDPLGGRGHFLTGGFLGGMFATPWRLEQGPLLDLGPHVIDLLDAALGPVAEISARGDPHRWIALQLVHGSGVVSQASITAYSAIEPARAGVEVYAAGGALEVDTTGTSAGAVLRLASEFAATARSRVPHQLDVEHGVRLQALLASASAQLA